MRVAQISRPRAHVRQVVGAALVVDDGVLREEERDEVVAFKAVAQTIGGATANAAVEKRLLAPHLHDVAPVGATDGAVDAEELSRGTCAREEAPGEDRDLDPTRLELLDREDVLVLRLTGVIEERPVEIDREQLVRTVTAMCPCTVALVVLTARLRRGSAGLRPIAPASRRPPSLRAQAVAAAG